MSGENTQLTNPIDSADTKTCFACVWNSVSKFLGRLYENVCDANYSELVWKFFCLLAGQYINYERSSSKCFSFFGLFWCFFQLCVCVLYVGTVGTIEGLRIANLSFLVNTTDNDSINCTLPQEHWKFTTAVTISAFAAISSYCLMALSILIPVFIIRCKCCHDKCCSTKIMFCCCSKVSCIACKEALRNDALSPYNDDDDSSKLSAEQTCYFFTNYLVVILLFVCSFVSSIVYAVSCTTYDRGYCWIDSLYLTMIVLQLISQFCAI